QATEPAEVLWRLCDFCTEMIGLSAAEAYLACGKDATRLQRVGGSGEPAIPVGVFTAARLEELLAGYRSVLLLKRIPSTARPSGNGTGHVSSDESHVPSAILPIRSADRTLGLLVLCGSPRALHASLAPLQATLAPYLEAA